MILPECLLSFRFNVRTVAAAAKPPKSRGEMPLLVRIPGRG